MQDRRLVGIDLGITSAHTVRVLDAGGRVVCRRRAAPTVEDLTEVEQAALASAAAGTRLEVVIEPTGPAWLPIAVFFTSRGHTVFRVSSAKAADLRRFLKRHAKSNSIDADTLARLPLVDPAGLHPLQLPDAPRAALDRRVRATDRLTRQAATHKRRIKDLVRQLLPASPLTGELGAADLAVLEATGGDPHALLAAGRARLLRGIGAASHGQQGAARAQQWLDAARAALALYAGYPAVAFTELAAEVATEVRLLAATQVELARHAREREGCYQRVDPAGLARSLPGLAEIGGPALVATMGPPGRFATAGKFRAFTGLAPRASETGNTDRKGQPISKAGSRLLRTTLVRAADNARRLDPQLARIYYVQMVQRGKDHLGAVCVVAAHLAERARVVMDQGRPYVVCDTDGTPCTPAQANQLIAERWTVPEEVRRRRRSRKGKALNKSSPDMCMALKAQRGDPPPRRPVLAGDPPASSQPNHQLDTQTSIGNQRSEPATCSRSSSCCCMPTSMPEAMIMSRSCRLWACTSSVRTVRPSTSVKVTMFSTPSSSGTPGTSKTWVVTIRSLGTISRYWPWKATSTPPAATITYRHLPPTRRSISTVVVSPWRPLHQRLTSAGVVQAR
jgi:transposase